MDKLPKPLHYSLLLAILGVIVGSLLAITNYYTAPIIEENKMKVFLPLAQEVIPEVEGADQLVSLNEKVQLNKDIKNVFLVYADSNKTEPIAIIYWTSTLGYDSGEVETLIAIDLTTDQYIDAKVFTAQNQTAGIGDKILTHDFKVKGKKLDFEVDIIAGATVSSNAVKNALREASNHYIQNAEFYKKGAK